MIRLLFFCVFTLTQLQSNGSLVGTSWTFEVAKGHFDIMKFHKNKQVTSYDCEIDYTFHSFYTVSKDTVTVTERDDSHDEDHGKVLYSKIQYLLQADRLYPISRSELTRGKWKNSEFKFDKKYFFTRVRK